MDELTQQILELSKHTEEPASAGKPRLRKLFIAISLDKGLCGGVHSSVPKATRQALKFEPRVEGSKVVPVEADSPGDKSKA
jgi:F-type H+-transporting ATPase subunit gamma